MNVISRILIAPVRFYQRFISPAMPPTCRYYPSCSTYTVRALEIHGPVKGLILGIWRFLRCNPWSRGGVDHVPEKGQWKPEPYVRPKDDEWDETTND